MMHFVYVNGSSFNMLTWNSVMRLIEVYSLFTCHQHVTMVAPMVVPMAIFVMVVAFSDLPY
eukprot:COSAG01_NODE_39876_length_471_cov_0.637097_1_plen_61_part_00